MSDKKIKTIVAKIAKSNDDEEKIAAAPRKKVSLSAPGRNFAEDSGERVRSTGLKAGGVHVPPRPIKKSKAN